MSDFIIPENLPDCPEGIYSQDQRAYRVYANAPISLFGILSNLLNIVVFMDCEMRQQLVNHFLLALSVSDLLLLMCNFFFLVLPVLVDEIDSFFWNDFFPYIIRYSYPLALTVQTSGVYLTVLVSVHRFLGVCHPFKAKRWVSRMAVEWAIVGSLLFSFAVNIPTWLELGVTPCFSARFNRTSRQIQLSSFHNMTYILLKKCLSYTILMFIVPFGTLITVNWKMVAALRSSSRMRTKHTYSTCSNKTSSSENIVRQLHLLKNTRYSEFFKKISNISYSSLLRPSAELFRPRFTNSTRDRSITLMLLAIVGLFLLCNGLAFLNSIVESLMLFTGGGGGGEDEPQQNPTMPNAEELLLANSTLPSGSDFVSLEEELMAEDWTHRMIKWFESSVEVSNVLITLNSSTSTLIYLIFSSKYRMIVKWMLGLQKRDKFNRVAVTTAVAARRVMELSLIPEEVENRSRSRRATTVRRREFSTASSLMRDSVQSQTTLISRPTMSSKKKCLPRMSSLGGEQLLENTRKAAPGDTGSAASQRRAMFRGPRGISGTTGKDSAGSGKGIFRSQQSAGGGGTDSNNNCRIAVSGMTSSESNLRLMDELETGTSPEKSPAPIEDDDTDDGRPPQSFEMTEIWSPKNNGHHYF